jgi:hypothetical protein
MRNKIALFVGMLIVGSTWLWLAPNAIAQPEITVSPNQGSVGNQVSIKGEGFEPGETIYLEIFPLGGSSPYRIGNVVADSFGRFSASGPLGNVYPGLNVPEPAPPGEGQQVNLAPGQYQIMAYPASFGTRTPGTIEQAPKVGFEVTVSSLPDTGGPPAPEGGALPASVIFSGLLFAASVLIFRVAIGGRST